MPTDTEIQKALTKIIANTEKRRPKRLPNAEQIARDKKIILMYAEGMSLADIANHEDMNGMSRQRVHQIITRAIKNHTK